MPASTQNEIAFAKLPRFQERRFVPEQADLTDVGQVKNLLEKLLKREIASAKDLDAWLLDRSELEAALDQEGAILYIRMTCQTDDPKRAKAYQDFISTVVPEVNPLDH